MVLFNNNSLSVHSTGNSNVQKQTIAELHYKDACDFATTSSDNLTSGYTESHANQTITADAVGAVTIDGQTLALGNRILVKNQTDTKENGIYKVTTLGSGSAKLILTRAGDFDAHSECPAGGVTFVIVSRGTENVNKSFIIGAGTEAATTTFGTTTFSISGGAAASSEITVADESSDTSCNVLYTTAASGNLAPKTGSNLTFNSNSGELTATSFVGALTGNVTGNASGSSGSCTGNANTATTATNITVSDDESSDEECFPVFTTEKSGNKPPKTKTTLTFDAKNGKLTATSFAGALTGNVTGNASGSSGSCTGIAGKATKLNTTSNGIVKTTNSDGTLSIGTLAPGDIPNNDADTSGTATTATNANNIYVADESTDTTCFPVFTTAATGNSAPKTGSNLTFNSNSGELTATTFVGALTGNASGSSGSCTGTAASATKLNTTSNGIVKTTSSNGTLSIGALESGDIPDNAADTTGTASNIKVATDTTDTTCFPIFTKDYSGNLGPKTNSTKLKFNSSTGTLEAVTFKGKLMDENGDGVTATATELNILDESAVSVDALGTEDSAGDDGVLAYDHSANTISWKTLATVCFLEGTKITLSDKTQKNIEEIKTNDSLLSYKFKNLDNYNQDLEYLMNWYSKDLQGEISRTQVSQLWENETNQYYIINDKLKITPEHLLFIRKNGKYEWYPAKNIKKSYYLLTSGNRFEKIESLELVEERTKVYNLKLDGIMNYYADNYLVHCSSKCDECENNN